MTRSRSNNEGNVPAITAEYLHKRATAGLIVSENFEYQSSGFYQCTGI
jgi:2,4-dienoyl-CoA reductase-like NADH-dependent reductase (Old Yellow Enzyme family)